MISKPASETSLGRVDLVIVGAGIVGLAHAVHAVARGLSVAVVERDEQAVGASIRNFGHGCITAQSGVALRYAQSARTSWVKLAADAGFWLRESGTVVVARAEDEYAVLEDFHGARGDDVVLLDRAAVAQRVPVGPGVVGGAWLPRDIRVDPRAAIPAIAAWLQAQGVTFHWSTAFHSADGDGVRTSRGVVAARRVVIAVGHDVDRHFPELADEIGLQRCALHMLRVAGPAGVVVEPAVLTGFSLLRYDGFAVSPALADVRRRLTTEEGDAVAAGLNLMYTQRPNGDLTIGDTHAYSRTTLPFQDEARDELILRQASGLLGTTGLAVRERWQGIYASARDPFLIAAPAPSLRVVSVTSGIGMTTALGLAAEVIDGLL